MVSIRTIREHNLTGLLMSKTIIKISPTFSPTLKFYLTTVFLFSANNFSQITLVSEFALLLGVLALNTVFKDANRKLFLRINGFLLMMVNASLIPIVILLNEYKELPRLAMILFFSAMHSLIYEIFNVPMVSIFLEICPRNLEGFFMSVIFFTNNFSRNISMFLGAVIIYALSLDCKSLADIICLIFIHVSVNFMGFVFLASSHIPSNPQKRGLNEEYVEEVDNKHLAYINSAASIVIEGNKTLADISVYQTRRDLSRADEEEEVKYFTSAEKNILAMHGQFPGEEDIGK